MSKLICASAIDGAKAWIDRAAKKLAETAAEQGDDCRIGRASCRERVWIPV